MTAALDRDVALAELERFEAVPGLGVRAFLGNECIQVGNVRFMKQGGVSLDAVRDRIYPFQEAGRTVIIVARGGVVVGLLALGDTLRQGAREAVAALRRAGVKTILMSGDNAVAARRVASEAGIDEAYGDLLPQDKVALIRKLQQNGNVAMVGDGINDAPALMQANVGIAMGSGTDIAIDAADIVVLSDRLQAIVEAREISRWSYRKMLQNVCLAILFNGIGVPLAATGLVYPIWAMAAMAISVTAIFFNSLRGRPRLFFDAVLSVGRGASLQS
jgi:P-type E1-E2 ATPase